MHVVREEVLPHTLVLEVTFFKCHHSTYSDCSCPDVDALPVDSPPFFITFQCLEMFGASFGKVSCLVFSLFARLCTRTELNSGLCCAADCIGDGSALGPAVRGSKTQVSAASFWSLPSDFLVNSLNYHLVIYHSHEKSQFLI